MTTRKTLMAMTALVAMTGGMAAAQVARVTLPTGPLDYQNVSKAFTDAGYDYVEIKYGPTQIKVEAVDNGSKQKVEAVYDRTTGALITTEMEPAGDDLGRTGIVTTSVTRDFEDDGIDDNTGSDDNTGDDDRDDNTSGSDDDGDDSTSGSDDDGNDSSGGDDS